MAVDGSARKAADTPTAVEIYLAASLGRKRPLR